MSLQGEDGPPLGDLHSHLIPGVDDGVPDLPSALEAVARLAAAGVRRIVTTPHLRGSLTRDPEGFRERMAEVDDAWDRVAGAVSRGHPDLIFRRGHEVELDLPNPDLSDPRVRLGGTSYVLVEWSRFRIPPGTTEVIARLGEKGVRPILAHPERFGGLSRRFDLVEEWRRSGLLLQVNHDSLTGRHGSKVRQRAVRLLERGWVDLLSSDFHGWPGVGPGIEEARALLEGLEGGEHFELLCSTNPRHVMADEETRAVPPLEGARGLWDRLVNIFTEE